MFDVKKPWQQIIRSHPSALLLVVQLLSLVVYPALDGSIGSRALFGALSLLAVLLAVWVVNRTPALNSIAWALAVPAILITIAAVSLRRHDLLLWSSLLEAALYLYAAGALIAYMMGDSQVTVDELYAAGATFTLLAWGFAYAFYVCQALQPGSFSGVVDPAASRSWIELLFLSFTNLSATGLSDILPISAAARVLVMLEQFCGIGYIAIVVSRLIGLSLVRTEKA